MSQRGLRFAPEIAVGDGALGFWKALDEIFPDTRHQRCWLHKTVNVLDKVPLSVQANMKQDLREIYWAPDRSAAEAAIDLFAEKYNVKYGRAVDCLTKDRGQLLAFYDLPAEHWDHLHTTNPIESVFATVRHRTVRTKRGVVADHGQADGVQTDHRGIENMATAEGHKSVAESHRGCQIQRWSVGRAVKR
jgi:transposase-like protein